MVCAVWGCIVPVLTAFFRSRLRFVAWFACRASLGAAGIPGVSRSVSSVYGMVCARFFIQALTSILSSSPAGAVGGFAAVRVALGVVGSVGGAAGAASPLSLSS